MKNHHTESEQPTEKPHAFGMLALLPPRALHFYVLVLAPLVDSFPNGFEVSYQALADKLNAFPSSLEATSRFQVRNLLTRIQSTGLITIEKRGNALWVFSNARTGSSTKLSTAGNAEIKLRVNTVENEEKPREMQCHDAIEKMSVSTDEKGDKKTEISTVFNTTSSTAEKKNDSTSDYKNNYINKYNNNISSTVEYGTAPLTTLEIEKLFLQKGFLSFQLKKPKNILLIRAWVENKLTAAEFSMAMEYAEAKLGRIPEHIAYYRNFVHEVLEARSFEASSPSVKNLSVKSNEAEQKELPENVTVFPTTQSKNIFHRAASFAASRHVSAHEAFLNACGSGFEEALAK